MVPRSQGLCRLSPVPAGRWPFPTLSLQSLRRRLDPYPAVSSRCDCPLLPWKRRPHATGNAFGTREYPCKAVSTGSRISGLQSFDYLQAPTLARPPGCSHRNGSKSVGRPGRLHHASPRRLPALRCGIATCPTWATDMVGLPPTGLQPCRLLLPAPGSRTRLLRKACTKLQDAGGVHETQRPVDVRCGVSAFPTALHSVLVHQPTSDSGLQESL